MMRIIDAHAHLIDKKGYLENLMDTMDDCNIEKCCISGLGKLFMCEDNNGVRNLIKKHPKRFIGAYFIRPGVSKPLEIRKAYEEGFQMLKVTIPKKPYDHLSFFELWEVAQELGMPILFHTGVVTLPKNQPQERVSSWYMHPMRLELLSNSFPDLKIIIAHLGIHWNEDAAELLRMKDNIYADLTGEPDGWRVRTDQIGVEKYLWWSGAFKKIIFGTDVSYEKIPLIIKQDMDRLEKLNINQETRELIFHKNILKLIGEI